METDHIDHFEALVFDAHYESATRGNLSGEVLRNAFHANGNRFPAAVSAALGTLGGVHGPADIAQRFLETDAEDLPGVVRDILEQGGKVPGWGSSFSRGRPDPIWKDVHAYLPYVSLRLSEKLERVTQTLLRNDVPIYPNPAAYTACLSIVMGLPSSLAPSLFIEARLPAWRDYIMKDLNSKD